MDPDAALTEARNAARIVLDNLDAGAAVSPAAAEAAEKLAESFQALDGWMSAAGFLPFDWMKGRTR